MTYRPNQAIAAEIQSQLRKTMEHDHIRVKPSGRHFLIQVELEDDMETVARITAITSRTYGAALSKGFEGLDDDFVAELFQVANPGLDDLAAAHFHGRAA